MKKTHDIASFRLILALTPHRRSGQGGPGPGNAGGESLLCNVVEVGTGLSGGVFITFPTSLVVYLGRVLLLVALPSSPGATPI